MTVLSHTVGQIWFLFCFLLVFVLIILFFVVLFCFVVVYYIDYGQRFRFKGSNSGNFNIIKTCRVLSIE